MFSPYTKHGKEFGYSASIGRAFYFFGTGQTSRTDLEQLFPEYQFAFLKQVHGRTVVPAEATKTQEADGHYTSTPHLALVSQSADCMPVLFGSDTQVCAVHAGWRGMAANIIQAALDVIAIPKIVALGPHIMQPSFEIEKDVADQLLKAGKDPNLLRPGAAPGKYLFNLRQLAQDQLNANRLRAEECCFDTKTDLRFHSYRRGRQSSERQYSFVVLTK